jgi:hypothetical protein
MWAGFEEEAVSVASIPFQSVSVPYAGIFLVVYLVWRLFRAETTREGCD